MEINEFKIKLTGTANVIKELVLGKSYDLHLTEAEVRSVKEIPNDDNTKDRIYTIQISELSAVQIISEKETIRARKMGSQSQKLRVVLIHEADEAGQDRELYYKNEMTKIIKERLK